MTSGAAYGGAVWTGRERDGGGGGGVYRRNTVVPACRSGRVSRARQFPVVFTRGRESCAHRNRRAEYRAIVSIGQFFIIIIIIFLLSSRPVFRVRVRYLLLFLDLLFFFLPFFPNQTDASVTFGRYRCNFSSGGVCARARVLFAPEPRPWLRTTTICLSPRPTRRLRNRVADGTAKS